VRRAAMKYRVASDSMLNKPGKDMVAAVMIVTAYIVAGAKHSQCCRNV